jgi:CHAT domain-containing protein
LCLILATALATGCRQPDWQTRYSSAFTEFRNGNSEAALNLIGHLPENPGKHDSIWYWRARILRAQIFLRQNQPAQALSFLSAFPAKVPDEILAKQNLFAGEALCQTGKAEDALKRFAAVERIISTTMPGLRADLLYARGDCISDDHSEEAIRLFSQAAALAHGNDSLVEARSLAYEGYLLSQSHHCDRAIELFDQALTITDSPFLKQKLLGNKGWCSQALGEWIASGVYLRQAIAIASHTKDAKADHALWLLDLGRQQLSQMEYDDAQQSFREVLNLANQIKNTDLAGRCLIDSAATAIVQGNLVHAKEQIAAAEQINNLGQWKSYLMLTKARLLLLEGNAKESEVILNAVIAANPDDHAKWLAESGLAETFVAEKRIADADRMFQKAIATFERGFDRISSEQFRITFMDQDPFYDAYVSFLVSQGRQEDALRVAEHGRSRDLAESRKLNPQANALSIPAIQRRLTGTNQIILAYWLTTQQSYLWLISPKGFKTFTLAPEMDIVREIEAYDRTTADQSEDQTPLGQNLFKMLVAPAEKFIPKGARVIIVPHRRLYKLNFETLITDGEKPHFWIEDVCIQNASFLAGLEKPSKGGGAYKKQLLLMGNPVEATKEFPGLAHAAQEMQAVSARFAPSGEAIYAKANATPESYESSDPAQFRFLHFVTHGTASNLNPLESAIILSPGKDGFKLYARDIINTQIHPELVTISSCYGAGTRQYSGEGLVGLSWAFLRAGAHNVIGALWETDDEANVKLMETFYGEMKKKDDPAAALRTAKLALLHSDSFWKRPFYWGALQLYSSN